MEITLSNGRAFKEKLIGASTQDLINLYYNELFIGAERYIVGLTAVSTKDNEILYHVYYANGEADAFLGMPQLRDYLRAEILDVTLQLMSDDHDDWYNQPVGPNYSMGITLD